MSEHMEHTEHVEYIKHIKQNLEKRMQLKFLSRGYLANSFTISEGVSDKHLVSACRFSFDVRFSDSSLEEILQHSRNGHFYKIHIMINDDRIRDIIHIILANFEAIAELVNAFKYLDKNLVDAKIKDENEVFHLPTFVFYVSRGNAQQCLDLMIRLFGEFETTIKPRYNTHVKGAVFYSGGSRDHKIDMLKLKQQEDELIRKTQLTNPSFSTNNGWADVIKNVWEPDFLHYRGQKPLELPNKHNS